MITGLVRPLDLKLLDFGGLTWQQKSNVKDHKSFLKFKRIEI